MTDYNPNEVGKKGNVFGYPYSLEEADLILIQVPWEVTVSYGSGTAKAPELIIDESVQLDFSIPNINQVYKYPIARVPFNTDLKKSSQSLRKEAEALINKMENGETMIDSDLALRVKINQGCFEMTNGVKNDSLHFLNMGKVIGLIGGDHSTPLGLIQALGTEHVDFGILQIDAHMDLRNSYQGFSYSHASIMKNALEVPSVSRLVQVGIRDYCEEEERVVSESQGRIKTHFDERLLRERWAGTSWPTQVHKIIQDLPQKVYVSFDVDGLEPSLCQNTGTPVPGGLSFYEATFLVEAVVQSGREIIGFDVSEAGDSIWDANVAARILFRLCAYTGISRSKLAFI